MQFERRAFGGEPYCEVGFEVCHRGRKRDSFTIPMGIGRLLDVRDCKERAAKIYRETLAPHGRHINTLVDYLSFQDALKDGQWA